MSQIEYEEIYWHVLKNVFIRESNSPCVVPTILTPKKDDHLICMLTVEPSTILQPSICFQYQDLIMCSICWMVRNFFLKLIYEVDTIILGYDLRWMEATFKTIEGLHKWLVMLFSLLNVPNIFLTFVFDYVTCIYSGIHVWRLEGGVGWCMQLTIEWYLLQPRQW